MSGIWGGEGRGGGGAGADENVIFHTWIDNFWGEM